MGFIKKYSYIRAVFIGIPFGIASLVVGINQFKNTAKSVDDLKVVTATVESFGVKNVYDKEAKMTFNVFYIKLNNKDEFYSALGQHKDLLRKNLPKMLCNFKEVTIWYKQQNKYIEQLSVGDELIIKYSKSYWIAHFFLWLGAVTLASALIYVIKHPEDLTGKKPD